MATSNDTIFREESSLLNLLREGIHDDSELRLVISSLVLRDVPEELKSNPSLYTIFRLSEMILRYEDFCEGGPDGIL